MGKVTEINISKINPPMLAAVMFNLPCYPPAYEGMILAGDTFCVSARSAVGAKPYNLNKLLTGYLYDKIQRPYLNNKILWIEKTKIIVAIRSKKSEPWMVV